MAEIDTLKCPNYPGAVIAPGITKVYLIKYVLVVGLISSLNFLRKNIKFYLKYKKIITIYPTLSDKDFFQPEGTITLQNDSDGRGDYIKSWNHPTLAQPTQAQLDAITE